MNFAPGTKLKNKTLPDGYPKTSTIQPPDNRKVSGLPSGEKATSVTQSEWPSNVCSGAPARS